MIKSVKKSKSVFNQIAKPIATIFVLLFIAIVGIILLNRPRKKDIEFILTCKAFKFYVHKTLELNGLASIHLRGFEGLSSRITTISFDSINTTVDTLFYKWDKNSETTPSPTIICSIAPRVGHSILKIDKNIFLSVGESDSETVSYKIIADTGGQILVTIESDIQYISNFNRYKSILPPHSNSEANKIILVNKEYMVHSTFSPIVDTKNKKTATVTVFRKTATLKLFENYHIDNKDTFMAYDCDKSNFQIINEDYKFQSNVSSSDYAIITNGMSLKEVSLVRSSSDSTNYVFEVRGTGTINSLKQNNHELLPSWLSEILSSSPEKKGIWGVVGALLILCGGVLTKRSIDILAEFFLPPIKKVDNEKKYY